MENSSVFLMQYLKWPLVEYNVIKYNLNHQIWIPSP